MNIVYNASAGTGKTYQVTQLYEKLVLEDGIDPRDILLMTFTDNAAAELRMRVAHRLLKARRKAEAGNNDERSDRAISASSKLAAAPIGTIHSFCTRMLREHALEAGLSPGFSVLAGDDRDEMLDQICRDELLSRLDTDPDFKTFCSGAHMIGTRGGFGTSITETVPALIAQAGSLGISLEHAESLLPEPLPPITIGEFSAILIRLRAIAAPTKKVIEAIQLLDACIAEATDACQVADRFDQKFSGHFSYGDARAIYPEFKALKEEARDRQLYRERFSAGKAFARYVQAVVLHFAQRKHEMNTVDFDDQLRLAAKLLQSGTAAPGFRYVIVDEVQDTSRIQCDIIQALWMGTVRHADRSSDKAGGRDDADRPPETNLVICGDKKQSIYTWRGADPQVMPDLQQLILDAGGKLENLQTSYRSKSPILEVVNRLFSTVYGENEYSEKDNLLPNPDFATGNEKPCIEYLSPDEGADEWSKPEKVAAEMEAVANRIRLLVQGPDKWKPAFRYADEGFLPVDTSNKYMYSDILILLRRTTYQSALEQALRHADIPYTLGGKGRGLFTRQETRDVSLFLNVLTDPGDAYSLVGFLRSPWIGLSDEEIAELAWSADGFSVDHLMEHYAAKTDVIDRYRALPGTRLASELVRMLIDETGYDALLAGLPRGTQRLANLRKVLDWLRETERGAHTTPAAVARKLAEQIANPPQVPEAALLDPAQNAVTIMTVHGAKGLTKRVVFIPDMSFSDQGDRSFAHVFFDGREPRLGLRITAPDRSSVKSPGLDAASRLSAEVRRHESNNLFYVAMTRARDLVVTSASAGQKPAGWRDQMEPLIGTGVPAISYSELARDGTRSQPMHSSTRSARQLAKALATLPEPPPQSRMQRIPATRLAREQDDPDLPDMDEASVFLHSTPTSAVMGSLGHAVLEQLALNNWQGSVSDWLDKLHHDFSIKRKAAAALTVRIERTRDLMIKLTSRVDELYPEFPFVLHHDDRLIDGSIDLLCHSADGFSIFDYKFTEAETTDVMKQYRAQMEIYQRAAEQRFPRMERRDVTLIIVSSKDCRPISVDF